MSREPIKISNEELSEIKMLQTKFHETILKLGNLQVEKMELDRLVTGFVEKEKKLKEEWLSLQQLEQGVIERIIQNYGEGDLSISDGTFIPSAPRQEQGKK